MGVSEPEDNEDVEDGDILEELVVRPRGRATVLLELDVAAARPALVNTELMEDGTEWLALAEFCAAIKFAPNVLWYVSSSEASGEPPLAAARCWAAAGPYKLR